MATTKRRKSTERPIENRMVEGRSCWHCGDSTGIKIMVFVVKGHGVRDIRCMGDTCSR